MLLSTAFSARNTDDVRERGRPDRWPNRGGRRSSRPRLEVLEERALLSYTDIVIDNGNDPRDPESLPYALANSSSGDTIAFASSVTGTIMLTAGYGPLDITHDVNIEGPGANNLTISGNDVTQVFNVSPGVTATIAGLTIASGAAFTGGGIYNEGRLTVTNCTLSGNSASADGGGIDNLGVLTVTNSTLSGNSAHEGGGIDNYDGTTTVTNSTLSGNSAFAGGGGIANIFGVLTVTNSTLSGNSATGDGGGIDNSAPVTVATLGNTIIAENTAPTGPDVDGPVTSLGYNLIGNSAGGSGFAASDLLGVNPFLGPLQDNGGPTQTMALLPGSPAIDAGNNALVPSGITTDQRGAPREVFGGVDIGAFGVQVYPVYFTTDSGGGSLRSAMIQANQYGGSVIAFTTSGVIDLASPLPEISRDVQILGPGANNLTVSGNLANQVFYVSGGVTATIAGLTIADGYATEGGGIENVGTLTVTDCTLSGNHASHGAGIYNVGALTVTNSTVSGNDSSNDSGGIFNFGALTVTNSTLSGNSASADGGGIENVGALLVTNCTLSGNSASERAGGIASYFGTMTMANTIIAGNTAPSGPDLFGPVTSNGYNLIGNPSGGSGFVSTDLLNVNDLLGPLQNNGGPTETMALLPGSPALGTGSVALAVDANGKPLTTDQRGSPRLTYGWVDIGAFESRGFTMTVTSGNNQQTDVRTAFAAPLVVTVSSPYGEPVAGGVVIFTAPASGASATFSGGSKTATINASGQASIGVAANTTAGSYVVSALVPGAFISNFDLTNTPGPPIKLVIQTQPSATATAGKAFGTQPVIYVEDQYGNMETGDNSTRVRVGLKTGTGPLLGTTTVTVAGGIAAFSGLADKNAERIVLVFGSGTLARSRSNKITISRDPAKAMAIGARANVKLKASLAAYLFALSHPGSDVN